MDEDRHKSPQRDAHNPAFLQDCPIKTPNNHFWERSWKNKVISRYHSSKNSYLSPVDFYVWNSLLSNPIWADMAQSLQRFFWPPHPQTNLIIFKLFCLFLVPRVVINADRSGFFLSIFLPPPAAFWWFSLTHKESFNGFFSPFIGSAFFSIRMISFNFSFSILPSGVSLNNRLTFGLSSLGFYQLEIVHVAPFHWLK